MLKVKFQYRDECNYPDWSEQECVADCMKRVYDIYGLNHCEHKILNVIDLDKETAKTHIEYDDRNAVASEIASNEHESDKTRAEVR